MTDPVLSISTPNGRMYQHPRSHAKVPSITNVIGMKDKPALKFWAARECATFAASHLDSLATLNEKERIDLIKGAPFRSSGTAADRGDSVHGWIDEYVKASLHATYYAGPDLGGASVTSKNMWAAWLAFVDKYKPEWVASEFTVWSDKHEYAGTGDLIFKIKGAYVWCDTKTGKGVYPEVGMQVSALRGADYMFTSDGEQMLLPKFDRGAVLHIRPRSARLSPLCKMDESFEAFLGLRAVFRWHVEHGDSVIGAAPKIEA